MGSVGVGLGSVGLGVGLQLLCYETVERDTSESVSSECVQYRVGIQCHTRVSRALVVSHPNVT